MTINKQDVTSITILGAGAFGFAMAHVLSNNNPNIHITLFDIQEAAIKHIQDTKEHLFFHKGIKLPSNVSATTNLDEAINNKAPQIILLAVPSKFARSAFNNLNGKIPQNTIFLNVAKGLEPKTNNSIQEILNQELGQDQSPYHYATLSGGMIASEVTANAPLGADIACQDINVANLLKELTQNQFLKIRTSTDTVGTQLAGALKNVIAIGAGIIDSNLKESSKSGYISAISVEMQLLAIKLGAKQETFEAGSYAWWGDLMTTCFGASRNLEFGRRVGKPQNQQTPEDILKQMYEEKKSVEGYNTIKAVYDLLIKNQIHAPITTALYQTLFENKPTEEFINNCM
ncbi:NAD(P)-binding domain-containing protein [archaeon]|jgi:glycerol-3-phosphate dehydrogenase (NAD(P)+)|nr:NAD(P)-binding domain-containing protein [archaeon]MBT6698522.1 NAD(P)-binding domain-containing protein [archaeon]